MFYRPSEGHGLAHNPFNAIVAPRPIGWIATRGGMGDNLAPYSFFNAVAYTPPQVVFASTSAKSDREGTKDSMANIRESGVFAVNIVSGDLLAAMNETSAAVAAGVDEFALAGVEKAECRAIDCPRVARAPATLECRMVQIVPLLGAANFLAVGEVVGVHIAEDCLKEGRFTLPPSGLMARLGYQDYAVIREGVRLARPGER
jgi:flavin reductase (DIM6/NTAB) family NADH-FMN oxidoreductase RutF